MVGSEHRVAKDTEVHGSIFRGMVAWRTQQGIDIAYLSVRHRADCIHCSTGRVESSFKRAPAERRIKLCFTPCLFSRPPTFYTFTKGTNTGDILPRMVDGQFIFARGACRNELHARSQA